MKKVLTPIAIVVACIVVIIVAKDQLIKTALQKGVSVATGLPLHIGSFHAGIISSQISVKDFVLENPKSYEQRTMINIPEVTVDFDLGAILKKDYHFERVVLDVSEVHIIKNKDGGLNFDALKGSGKKSSAPKEAKEPAPKESSVAKEPLKMRLDSVELRIGKVVYTDLAAGAKPREFKINLNEKFTNVTDPKQLVQLIIVRAMMGSSLGAIANLDVNQFVGNLGSVGGVGIDSIAKQAGAIGEKAAAVSSQAGSLLGGLGEGIGSASSDSGDKMKSLFGAVLGSEEQ